jgi:hypothetical protein
MNQLLITAGILLLCGFAAIGITASDFSVEEKNILQMLLGLASGVSVLIMLSVSLVASFKFEKKYLTSENEV